MAHTASTLVADLEATRAETMRYFGLGDADLARTYGPGKWSVRFLLHHLADSETVLSERIRRTLSEPEQTLAVFEQEMWANALNYATFPLDVSRDVFDSVRRGLIHLAREHYEAKGHLTFIHTTMGRRTLREEFDKVASHNAKHLQHIRTALGA